MTSRAPNRLTLYVSFSIALLAATYATAQNSQPSGAGSPSTPQKSGFEVYHAGAWEQSIGYSQAVRAGTMLYVSGTVGANAQGEPADLDSQMKKAYEGIRKTLEHYHTDLSHVVMERIYTTDIEALIRSQETRKRFYGQSAPAATWIEVKRLYGAADKIEIEVQAVLD